MRVLMFGWEFPPHIAGGLGTACYGMTRGLARNDVDVTFVVPHAYGDEDQRFTHVLNASDVEALYGSTGSGADDILEKMSFIHIDSNMVPYISPEEYEQYQERYVKSGQKVWSTTWQTTPYRQSIPRRMMTRTSGATSEATKSGSW